MLRIKMRAFALQTVRPFLSRYFRFSPRGGSRVELLYLSLNGYVRHRSCVAASRSDVEVCRNDVDRLVDIESAVRDVVVFACATKFIKLRKSPVQSFDNAYK